jgi:hypothetical protein
MASIFNKTQIDTVSNNIRQTMGVEMSAEIGAPVVTLAFNKGKGSGTQTIPTSEYSEVVSLLDEMITEGVPESSAPQSVIDVMRQTATIENGCLTFRLRNGKGSKPVKIPLNEAREVLATLREAEGAVSNAEMMLTPAE